MCSKHVSVFLLVLTYFLTAWGQGKADDRHEKILAMFHPYHHGPPRVEGIRPGMKIEKTNYQVAEAVLPSELPRYLQAGDFTITVQETTNMPLREAYMQATLAYD